MNIKESQTTEFKTDWRDEHLKAISAFANSNGGQLTIGLNDQGQPVGLTDTKKLLEDIPNKIMNAGSLPPEVPLEKLKTNHLSIPRNKLVATIFYYASFIEAWGRGTTMMVEKCREQGLPEPDFMEESGVMTVTFFKDKWTEENLKKLGLNKRQTKAVMYVKEKGKITNKNYKELIKDISRITATRDLSNLVERGLFKRVGTGKRQVYYVLNDSKKMQ